MAHRYHSYTDTAKLEDVSEKAPNLIRYAAMAFRPAGVLIFCLALTVIISIPCIIALCNTPPDSTGYSLAMAILTGVVASGLVSVSIELVNNYRHNRTRFVVLNEYLYMVSMYEEFIKWASHGDYIPYQLEHVIHFGDEDFELSPREKAVAEVILEFGPIMENALLTGREYLSLKELRLLTKAVDAASKLGEYAEDIADDYLKDRKYDIYNVLKEPFRTKIIKFSEEVGIRIVSEDLSSVVCDYVLSHINENEVEPLTKRLIVYCLHAFDENMHGLQEVAVLEPVLYDNLIPFDERVKKQEKKLGINHSRGKTAQGILNSDPSEEEREGHSEVAK